MDKNYITKIKNVSPMFDVSNLTPEIVNYYLQLFNLSIINYKYFIESGTFLGATIFSLSNAFKKLYTVEIKKELFDFCVDLSKKKNVNNIRFINSDSITGFKSLFENTININDNHIFYLDGHFSGKMGVVQGINKEKEKSFLNNPTLKNIIKENGGRNNNKVVVQTGTLTNNNVPLYEELSLIDSHINGNCFIIIDDIHLLGGKYNHGNWTKVSLPGLFEKIKRKTIIKSIKVNNRLLILIR